MRRTSAQRVFLGVTAALGLTVSCAARTDLGGYQTGSRDAALETVSGAVVSDCAPNDAPAIAFPFAREGAVVIPSCADSVVSALSIRFSFWSPIPNAPGEFEVGDGTVGSGSIATICPAKGQCVAATSGTFTLTTFNETSASGSFVLTLPDQTTIAASFDDVPICHNVILCG